MEKLYAIAGKARSGKDVVASIIEDEYKNKKVINYSCTFYLKKYIMLLSDWGGSDDDKPRELLQKLGREVKEKYPDYFIQRMREDIKFLSNFCDIMIITGIRLVNELDFLKKEFGAVLVKIVRDSESGLTDKQKQDITETDVDNYNSFDFIIDNNKDIATLKKKVLEEII